MFEMGKKCSYLNEILDGDDKPKFRVTPKDRPDRFIEMNSSSACWMHICKEVRKLNG
jgi:hypothetical protein